MSANIFCPDSSISLNNLFSLLAVANEVGEYLVRRNFSGYSIVHFCINIESTGTFPSNDCPKILWLGINKGRSALVELFKKIEKAVIPFIEVGTKEHFIPHVSIGRTTKFYGKVNVLPFLKYVYSPIELGVNSVTLFESQLLPNGAKYSAITEFQLK